MIDMGGSSSDKGDKEKKGPLGGKIGPRGGGFDVSNNPRGGPTDRLGGDSKEAFGGYNKGTGLDAERSGGHEGGVKDPRKVGMGGGGFRSDPSYRPPNTGGNEAEYEWWKYANPASVLGATKKRPVAVRHEVK